MIDVSSGKGTTSREVGVNNAERVGIGLAGLSRIVGVAIVMGKVIDAVELTVRDVTAEA